jgi:addiction module HigA family antidote
MTKLALMHPGEVLREEFMKPLNLSAYKLAERCRVPHTRIERIAEEKTGISADTALRFGKVFGTTPDFWLNLQSHYDMLAAEKVIGKELKKIEPIEMQVNSG